MCVADRRDANEILNHKVDQLVSKAKANDDKDAVLKLAANPKVWGSVKQAGTPIYVSRSRFPVYFWSIIATSMLGYSIYETSFLKFAMCTFGALAGYDLLSGFLHIVFDDTRNLQIPILGQPCLEFQMHHYFPTDLVQRNFLDVCGDLNFVVSFLFAWNCLILDMSDPIVRFMGALKFFMAYYGQFSHRSAHTPSSVNNKIVQGLRNLGLMIPLDNHRSHHRPPHDKDFCLVGVANPLINFLYSKGTRNRWFWMFGFFTVGLFGVPAEAYLMEKLFDAIGL